MTSNRKNKLSKSQKKSLVIAGSIVGVSLLLTFALATMSIARSQSNESVEDSEISRATETPYNEKTFREVFLANCSITAKTTLSEAAAKAYCGCVLDRGVGMYGMKRFIEINQDVAETYDFSDLKDLINECVAEVLPKESN